MDGTLKVSPSQLNATAQSMSGYSTTCGQIASQMNSLAGKLASQWEGSAASAFIQKINAEEQDVQDCVQKINKRLQELQEMAQNYAQAESSNESTASSLATDVVQV